MEKITKIRGFEPVSEAGLLLVPKMVESFLKKGFEIDDIYINEDYKEPKRATYESAGSDIFYTGVRPIILNPNEKCVVITNVKAYMQTGEMLLADVRSSQGMFKDLMLANTIGVVDKDYYNNKGNEGNIGIGLRNLGKDTVVINTGDAIAQLIFVPYLAPDNPPEEVERKDGFGSTK